MSFETLQIQLSDDAVAVITLNRPDALNALSQGLIEELPRALHEVVTQGARAIVLTGAGRAFSAGGDLREMKTLAQRDGRLEAFFEEPLVRLHDLIRAIRRAPVPIIAAVNGVSAGAGTNLALACDIVIAGASATFNQGFVKLGLTPDCGGTFILPRLVGLKLAAELLMTGDTVDAARALSLGMINRVVADDELMPEALSFARRLAQAPTSALARIKQLLEATATSSYDQQLDLEHKAQLVSGQSPDFKEGVAAFFEKRQPNFRGT